MFPKKISQLLSIMSALIMGAYLTQEFKYNQPIEMYRYVFTFVFGLMFFIDGNRK